MDWNRDIKRGYSRGYAKGLARGRREVRPRIPVSESYREHCAYEVAWYQIHGKFSDRITQDSQGVEYVIGDWSWNRHNPDRNEMIEPVG
jgi:hypothetical protein